MIEYHIKSNDWNKIYNFLTRCKGIHADEIAFRKFVEAIWYIARTGCQGRLLPKIYGTWNSIYKQYKRWTDNGIWKKLFEHVQIMPMMDEVMVDATIIRAHACSAGYKKNSQEQEALGRSRGGFSTKIHAVVDSLGNPLRFILTGGQRNEITQAEALLCNIQDAVVIAKEK